MIGGLVEYYNPSPGERYGVIREIDEEGKYSMVWPNFTRGTFEAIIPGDFSGPNAKTDHNGSKTD